METLHNLKDLLTITNMSESDIEKRFAQVAEALFNDYMIRKQGRNYRFVEIEFYHSLTDTTGGSKGTYKRISNAGEWFFHNSGVDLTFNSMEDSFGGILIRSISSGDDIICGPFKVLDVLFDHFDALSVPDNFPLIVPCESAERIIPVSTTRWNIDNDRRYRYCVTKNLWKEAKGYSAYPWSSDGKLKIDR